MKPLSGLYEAAWLVVLLAAGCSLPPTLPLIATTDDEIRQLIVGRWEGDRLKPAGHSYLPYNQLDFRADGTCTYVMRFNNPRSAPLIYDARWKVHSRKLTFRWTRRQPFGADRALLDDEIKLLDRRRLQIYQWAPAYTPFHRVTVSYMMRLLANPTASWSKWSDGRVAESERRGDKICHAIDAYRARKRELPHDLAQLQPDFLREIPQPSAGDRAWDYETVDGGRNYRLRVESSEYSPNLQRFSDGKWDFIK